MLFSTKVYKTPFFTCLFFLLVGPLAQGQNTISISIPWTEPVLLKFGEQEVLVPSIQDQSLSGKTPSFYWKEKSSKNKKLELVTFDSENVSQIERDYANEFLVDLTENPQIEYKVTRGGTDWFAVVSVKPFFKVNNQVRKVTKLNFVVKDIDSPVTQKDFVANSALRAGTGTWYKIAVEKDGIYKIDKAFLEGCGISTTSLNPNHIHIFVH
jgi:hypothetical protein